MIKSWQQTAQQILHQQILWGKKICVLSRTAFSCNLLKKLQNLEIRQLITKKGNPYIAGIINPVCSLGLLTHWKNIYTVGCKTIFYLLLCCWLSKGKKCLSFEAFCRQSGDKDFDDISAEKYFFLNKENMEFWVILLTYLFLQ